MAITARAKAKAKAGHSESEPRSTSSPGTTPARLLRAPAPGSLLGGASPRVTLGLPVQPKVVIGQPNNPYEREADAVAARITAGAPAPPISTLPPDGLAQRQMLTEATTLQPLRLQRQPTDEEEPLQAHVIQRQPQEETEEALVQPWPIQRQVDEGPVDEAEEPVQLLRVQRQEEEEETVQRQPAAEEVLQPWSLQRAETGGVPRVSAATAATIRTPGVGAPIPLTMRQRLEPQLGVSLSHVRVHTTPSAQRAAGALQARAFTHRNHIFLNRSESSSNLPLMAHEATHVVQQGATIAQRQPLSAAPAPDLQRLPFGIGERLNEYARYIPGYLLFTVIIGFNPLTGATVDRNAINLLQGLMGLVPFGTAIFDKLQEYGILQAAFAWVQGELARLDLSLARIERTIEAAWEEVDLLAGFDYNLGIIRRHFGALYDDVVAFALSLVDQIITLIKEAVLGVVEGLLADNRAWALIKKILHHDPLHNQPVEATTVEILADFLLLIGKEQELAQMRERGTLETTAAWLDTQLVTFLSLLGQLGALFTAAWAAIQPENLPNLGANLQSLATQALGFLQGVWDFAVTVATTVLQLIKDALLSWLKSFATALPGYHLITVILGRDVFTQEEVLRTPTNLIRGFMSVLPGGEQQFQQMTETGVIPAAAQRIESLLSALGISWAFVQELFLGIWNSLTITDLIDPLGAFQRIMDRFGEPIGRLLTFVWEVVKIVLELILQMMGFPFDLIGSIISNALQAIDDIKRDPIGFLLNLLAAMKLGFSNFFANIVQHLLSGLSDWLFRGLRAAGIEPPTDLSLSSILGFVLQVLGISMERIWQKLGERIGPENVARIRGAIDRLVGIWNFIKDVQERGVVAIWEYIESQISNLWNMVLQKAQEWIMERIINRAIQWLLSLLDVTGIMPVINSCIAFFRAVQSAIEYLRDILTIINDYVSTVASIARGAIEPGAQKLEQGLANAIPVAIGFLANQFGLGNIGEKMTEIIGGVRELVDAGLDWLLDQAMRLWQSMMRMLGLGGEENVEQGVDNKRPTITSSLDFLEEDHTLRLGPTSEGAVQIMMASDSYDVFPGVLRRLRDRQVARLNTESRAADAEELQRELDTLIEQAETVGRAGGPIEQARVNYQRQLDAVPRERRIAWIQINGTRNDALMDAWDEYYYTFLGKLNTLDARFDFSGGVRGHTAVGDIFADRTRNVLMKASEINVRQSDRYGILAHPANTSSSSGTSFYAYDQYVATGNSGWGPVGPVPPLLPYANVSPTSSSTRHVIINDAARKTAGSPSNPSEKVPGIDTYRPHRGHLIGNNLGGPGNYTSGNIVPMTINANESEMKTKLENPVNNALNSDPFKNDPKNNMIFEVKVTPAGWNPAKTIPMQVLVSYQKIHPIQDTLQSDVVDNM